MSEKVSTITLRLTAEEAAQLEILKDIIGKKSGSEAIKYVVKESYRKANGQRSNQTRCAGVPPFLYPLQAGSEGTRRTETKVPGARRSRAGFSVGTRQVGESGQGERVGGNDC